MRPTAVYRFFDHWGKLLYVGITMNPPQRWADHRSGKPWWSEIATIHIETWPTRADALDVEALAIKKEKPKYNVAGASKQEPEPDPLNGLYCRYLWGPDRRPLDGRVIGRDGEKLNVRFVTADNKAYCSRWLPLNDEGRWHFYDGHEVPVTLKKLSVAA